MKPSLVIAPVLLAIGLVSALGADVPAPVSSAPAAPAASSSLDTELTALMQRIQAKLQSGAQTETELAGELKAFDQLIAAHRHDKGDGVADAMYVESTLYSKVLQNYDRATELLQAVKAEYPRSRAAFAANAMLDQFDLEKDSIAIQSRLKPGAPFPDFHETDIAGAPVSVGKYKGKVVLVDFWATWCGPCVSELPNVQAAYAKYHDKGFDIVGISLDQREDQLKRFIADKHMDWQQFFDGKGFDNALSRKYGVNAIPATYLLDRNGRIVAKNLRGAALEKELARLLQ